MTDVTPFDDTLAADVANVLAGEGSVENHARIAEWTSETPDGAELLALLGTLRCDARQLPYEGDVAASRARLLHAIEIPKSAASTASTPIRTARRLTRPMAATVGLLAAVALFVVGYQFSGMRRTANGAPGVPQVYTTANGQRATVNLNDGTQVVLNVASRLEVPSTFGRETRTVRLIGEAAFTVAHASGTPFTIDAGHTKTAVLGTEFGVRAYASDSVVRVAVRDGRVRVNGVTLAANDVARFAGRNVEMRRDQSVDATLAFTRGKLVLTGEPLADVVSRLEQWYDVELRFGTPSLAAHRLETVLGTGSRTDLARTLELALHARVVLDGRTLTIYAR
jgi:ferric-dicitrate binding protein FerR (iron transport regulator)